jgi:hypothetical protein
MLCLITFDIAGVLFVGKDRILVQEAAGICYSKLNNLLTNGSDISPELSDHTNPLDQLRRLVIADVDTAACEKIDIQNQTNILPSTLRQGPFHSAHRLSRVL